MRRVFQICIIFTILFLTSPFLLKDGSKALAIIELHLPRSIYEGDRIIIDYSGAKKDACYAIFSSPVIPQTIDQISGTGCPRKIKSDIYKNIDYAPTFYDQLRSPEGRISLPPITKAGTYTLFVERTTGLSLPGEQLDTTKVSFTALPQGAARLELKLCVYPFGTDMSTASPSATACSRTKAPKQDIFIANAQLLNATNSGSISLYLKTGEATSPNPITAKTNDVRLATVDISRAVRNVSAPFQKETGQIIIYAEAPLSSPSGAKISSQNIRIAIIDLEPSPPVPPCNKWVEIDKDEFTKTGAIVERGVIPNDNEKLTDGKTLKACKEFDTAVGTIATDPVGLIKRIFTLVLGLSGGIALLLIIISGYRIMTSQGNEEKLQGARETLTSAVAGFLFIIFSVVILEVIGVDILGIPGLGR